MLLTSSRDQHNLFRFPKENVIPTHIPVSILGLSILIHLKAKSFSNSDQVPPQSKIQSILCKNPLQFNSLYLHEQKGLNSLYKERLILSLWWLSDKGRTEVANCSSLKHLYIKCLWKRRALSVPRSYILGQKVITNLCRAHKQALVVLLRPFADGTDWEPTHDVVFLSGLCGFNQQTVLFSLDRLQINVFLLVLRSSISED